MSTSYLAFFNDLGHEGMHMYSVVISTVGGLSIISFLEIKIEIDSRCEIEGHIVPHPIRVLSSILFQMSCHGNHKLAKYSHFFYNFLLNICHISVPIQQRHSFNVSN